MTLFAELTPAPGSPLGYLDGKRIELLPGMFDPIEAYAGVGVTIRVTCVCLMHSLDTVWVWPGRTTAEGHVILVPVGEG